MRGIGELRRNARRARRAMQRRFFDAAQFGRTAYRERARVRGIAELRGIAEVQAIG